MHPGECPRQPCRAPRSYGQTGVTRDAGTRWSGASLPQHGCQGALYTLGCSQSSAEFRIAPSFVKLKKKPQTLIFT